MNKIIVRCQRDAKALYYEAQGWVDLYEGNLVPKPPDEKPRVITLTDFTPSWAGINLTTDEMLAWLDKHLQEWLVVANWTPTPSANLSRVYSLLLKGGNQ